MIAYEKIAQALLLHRQRKLTSAEVLGAASSAPEEEFEKQDSVSVISVDQDDIVED